MGGMGSSAEGASHGARWWRVLLAGPLVFACAFLCMLAASVWVPAGPARIDNVAIPLLIFPLMWAGLFFYASLAQRLPVAYGIILGLTLVNGALVLWQLQLGFA